MHSIAGRIDCRFPAGTEANMKLTFQTQLTPVKRQRNRFSIFGIVACVVFTGAIQAQQEAPGYAPGSVLAKTFLTTEKPNEPAEVGIWEPPPTDTESSVSDWTPPETPARPAIEEAPFAQALGNQQQDQGNELRIEPADEKEEASRALTLPQEPAPAEPVTSEMSDVVELNPQTPPVLPLPSSSVVSEYEYPESCRSEVVCEDDVITFDEGSFVFEENLGACEIESTDGGFGDSYTSDADRILAGEIVEDACESGSCDEQVASRSIINDHYASPFKQPKLGANLLNRTVEASKNVVSKGHSIVSNAKIGQPNVLGRQRVYTPVRSVLGKFNRGLAGNEAVHAVGQLTFLSFARDYRNRGRQLSQGVPSLFSNGPDEGYFTGVDVNYGRRRGGGKGWEMRYIGFNPEAATDVSGNVNLTWGGLAPPLNDPATWGGFIDPNTPQTFGLSGLGVGGLSMADVFGDALNHRVTRDSEFGSFEFNLLRAGCGKTRLSCGDAVVELFGGLRGVAFNETMTFEARATQTPGFPSSAIYSSEVRNSLFGLQIGGRMERHKAKGWGYSFGTRVGIYNNRVESRQRAEFVFDDGSRPVPELLYGDDAGQQFDFQGTDNELAFLGELDFGLIYQFRPQTRARFGFRGIVVTNVATAADQLEDSLVDVDQVTQPRAIGDFIVGGLYFGVDHAF